MQEDEIELIDYLRVIWKRRWLIMGGTFACMLTAMLVSYKLPKVYQGSVILEVGKIYSPTKAEQQEKFELIENLEGVETILKSNAILQQLKERIEYDNNIRSLRNSIEINVKSNPLVILSLRLQEPQAIIDGLRFLSDHIINDHKKKHEITQRMLENDLLAIHEKMKKFANKIRENQNKQKQVLKKIKNTEAQILIIMEQIETDKTYQKTVEGQMQTAMVAIRESRSGMAKLDLKKISPLEILFLQTTFQNNEIRLASFQKQINDVILRMSERQKGIIQYQKQVADLNIQTSNIIVQNVDIETSIEDLKKTRSMLENLNAISENTKYRTAPFVSEKPVSPRKRLNTIIAGMVALITALMLAFFLEYLDQVRLREQTKKGEKG